MASCEVLENEFHNSGRKGSIRNVPPHIEKYLKDIASWEVPEGGLFIWVRINKIVSMRLLYSTALAKGILLNPGNIYGQDEGQYIRLSYAYASLVDLEKGICELSKVIRTVCRNKI
ncbi:hypothetical protein [Bacillus sp. JJ722]|uniref:hypothetical protein n=1 Tax=Bacillus sp. JJ722 TaxID=3122973 RepID=UPI0030008881